MTWMFLREIQQNICIIKSHKCDVTDPASVERHNLSVEETPDCFIYKLSAIKKTWLKLKKHKYCTKGHDT